ncbi:hypothetical protein [Pelomonas cellulosilytica]|uniref:PEP-CTERM sorting domain-containing protein n=1 Tax=Pelomonas cellulosilytica TaxID=2906762 RepID=A0ABS8XM09_9BURK|nr:hypothetical protein [Pelomonas sp. P8]MCE4553819.1 hypothetical protein [Pelomonas sp. P8]
MRRALVALALALAITGLAHAATVNVFITPASWQAALSGPAQTQDFSGYALGTDLTGTAVLPGVTLSSNIGPVEVFGADKAAAAFGAARATGTGYFEASYALPFLAAALDINAFEADPGSPSTAQDTGLLSFLFSDGSTRNLFIAGGDGSPIFVGIVSDTAITAFRWNEAHEANGGNEETTLDNLRVAMRAPGTPLPLPGTLPLAALALVTLSLTRRHRG